MKIGFDAKRAFYNNSGLGNYSRSSIELITKFYPQNSYILYTPSTDGAIEFNISKNVEIYEPKKFFNKIFKSYWRTFKISKKIKEHNLDVYHGLSGELPSKANKNTNTKLIVTIHDLIFLRFPELYKPIDRKIYYQKAKYACDTADRIIAISEQTKSDIIQFLEIDEAKIDIVYQGCNPLYHNEVDTNKKIEVAQKYNLPENYILNVGTIEKRKNSLSILKAIKEGNIKMPLLIVGKETEYQNEIIQFASENKLQKRLIILNYVPLEDLPAIYQQAFMFVYPSVFEGFGIPILEAIYSKIPVITTKGGVFSETGGHSSIYIELNDIKKLSEAIIKLIEDDEIRNKIIKDGLEFVQKFNDDRIAANLMNVYLK